MSRSVQSAFAALALFLVAFPLALAKPGLPLNLKSDEPAYYLMALSLARDFDLRCELKDIERLGIEFPYTTTKNLILASDDGWKTAYFGKPYLVSLVAAPATALFGANGFVATNMALLLLSVWLGALYLRQFNSDALALLYSCGYFLLSNAFAYVFWLHTETLCLASVSACLYLGFTPGSAAPARSRFSRWRSAIWNESTRPLFSGAALVGAVYNKPYLALLGVAPLLLAWRRRGRAGALAWLLGAAAGMAAVCAISVALMGHPTSYLGVERQGIEVDNFDQMPPLPEPEPSHPETGPRNSFSWIFSSFKFDRDTVSNLGYFLVGKHTGLFVYAPFVLLSLILFFVFGRRSGERWLLLGCLAGIALYSLTFIWFNWHGGGGFIGNRYYVNALPGFLFLVTRIAPGWLPLAGYALAGLFVGSIVFTPFGANVPSPTLQAHVRNPPFRILPFERTLSRQIPGYRGQPGGAGSFLFGRLDLFKPVGDTLWVVGGQKVDLELRTVGPLARPVFEVGTFATPNRVRIALESSRQTVNFAPAAAAAAATRVVLAPGPGHEQRASDGGRFRSYRLRVDAERQVWHTENVPFRESKKGAAARRPVDEGVALPDWEDNEVTALVGATVTYLGEESDLAADVFGIAWTDVPVPAAMPAGRVVTFRGEVRNASAAAWQSLGATAVDIGYRWLAADGRAVPVPESRFALPRDAAPGATVTITFEIATPAAPGTYTLVLDAVRERIAWFSERRPGQELRRLVEIVPPGGR